MIACRLRRLSRCLTLLVVALLLCVPPQVQGGTIRNRDAKPYKFTVHWDDLSPPETYEINPGEERRFEEKRATIELVGQRDSIYVRPGDGVIIVNGVMGLLPPPEPKAP